MSGTAQAAVQKSSFVRRFKPYPAYIESGFEWLRDVPEHWSLDRLKYAAPVRRSKLSEKPDDLLYVGLENIESWSGRLRLDQQPESVDSIVSPFSSGEVLFGKLRPYLAKVARPDFDGVCTSELAVLTPSDRCTQGYLFYSLLNPMLVGFFGSFTYGAKMPRVSPEQIGEVYIPIPAIPEQSALVDFLDRETATIDALIVKKERLIELLQEKRAALITRAVTKGLDPNVPMKDSGVEWLGEIPAHWEVKSLKLLASLRAGSAITAESIEESGEFPVYGGNGIRGFTSSYTHEGDFPLIGRQGALCGCVNFASGRFWASEHAVVAAPAAGVYPHWLAYLLQAMSLNSYSESAAQPGLAVNTISALRVPAPSTSEQRAITGLLDQETSKIDSLITKVREGTERLKEYRTALISAAVTGKIDVRDAV